MKKATPEEIGLFKVEMFNRDGWICKVCKRPIHCHQPQLGHRIPQRYLKEYGPEIIHHPKNVETCCSLACNHKVSIYGKTEKIKKLVAEIEKDLT